MRYFRVLFVLVTALSATPAAAQTPWDDFFGNSPPPKKRPKAVAPAPVVVPQDGGVATPAEKKPAAAKAKPATAPVTAPANAAKPPSVTQKPAGTPEAPNAKAPVAVEAPATVKAAPAAKPAAPAAVVPAVPGASPAAQPEPQPELARNTPSEPPKSEPAQVPAAVTSATPPPGLPPPSKPANCKNTGNFPGWLAGFRKDAMAAGISPGTISDVLDGMTLDQGIINRDRGGQKVFTQSFIDFSSKLANPGRLKSSIFKYNKHKALFQKAEAEYGVPGQVITAFWALESDFGSGMGNLPILRSLATLAYDCRRGEMFRSEFMAALKLIDRGDFRPEDMVGSWAGEIGQTQFLPGHVLRYALDYDGDGRADLYRSNADIIGTTANFIRDLGWRAGEPWLQEVKVSSGVPWQEADLAIKHPLTQWAQWGVKKADGSALDTSGPPASLVLPMGRNGPAFFAYPNFDVYTKWNQSLVYALTAAHLATRVAGAPAMSRGDPNIPMLSAAQVKELQQLMTRRGFYSGEVDGKMGLGTRQAVKRAQIKLRLPADSYPTAELLASLRGGN